MQQSDMTPLPSGSVIGIVGSGQLGRMLGQVAKKMGYKTAAYSPDAKSPLGQIADYEFIGGYEDRAELSKFCDVCGVVTFEFENINYDSLKFVSEKVSVRPNPETLFTFQNRLREKTFLAEKGIPTAKFKLVKNKAELKIAIDEIGLPAVLKTAGFGYDGKGQYKLRAQADVDALDDSVFSQEFILEQFIHFESEASVIAARSDSGDFRVFPLIRNDHRNHILDISYFPAGFAPHLQSEAASIIKDIMQDLSISGLICIEFFITSDQKILVNEVAPRTHNSGHLTIEAFNVSQFEQQLRSVCGLPLIEPVAQVKSAVMINLLGDIWNDGTPDFEKVMQIEASHLHLYGKEHARPGRKMGHLTIVSDEAEVPQLSISNARKILRIA